MFSGFRSRWMIPRECAAERPSATATEIYTAFGQEAPECARRVRRVSPSSSSRTT
jgi:hypothetical protein